MNALRRDAQVQTHVRLLLNAGGVDGGYHFSGPADTQLGSEKLLVLGHKSVPTRAP